MISGVQSIGSRELIRNTHIGRAGSERAQEVDQGRARLPGRVHTIQDGRR